MRFPKVVASGETVALSKIVAAKKVKRLLKARLGGGNRLETITVKSAACRGLELDA